MIIKMTIREKMSATNRNVQLQMMNRLYANICVFVLVVAITKMFKCIVNRRPARCISDTNSSKSKDNNDNNIMSSLSVEQKTYNIAINKKQNHHVEVMIELIFFSVNTFVKVVAEHNNLGGKSSIATGQRIQVTRVAEIHFSVMIGMNCTIVTLNMKSGRVTTTICTVSTNKSKVTLLATPLTLKAPA